MRQRVLVAQLGARMHYAVPRILSQAGALDHFFTDIYAAGGMSKFLEFLPLGIVPAPLRRLATRQPTSVPKELISSFAGFGWTYAIRRFRARTPTQMTEVYLSARQAFCRRVVAAGFGDATMVYGFNTASLELLVAARKSGLTTVLEQTIAPAELHDTLMLDEFARFPDWGEPIADRQVADKLYACERAEWEAADLILCGSEFVRRSIARCGGPVDRCVVVPYGVDRQFRLEPRKSSSAPLRVLTVARRLAGRAIFRMVGSCSLPAAVQETVRSTVEIIGTVPRGEILKHFAWADVFLLPSICEGSATAVYEALAAGLPVVCTPNTGSVVRDGVEGFIVPVGDSDAIVQVLDTLARDPELRRDMAERCQRRFLENDFDSYGKRLLSTLCTQASDRLPSLSAESDARTVAVA